MNARAALLVGAFAAAGFFFAVPAGAAPNVGHVKVSNPQPARASAIDVTSTGWRPGAEVAITLSGSDGVLAHATADANGSVSTRVSIPEHAPQLAWLAVVGESASGVPQQITTNLSVVGTRQTPASPRPWVAVYALLAVATALLLFSVRSEREPEPASRLTAATG